MLLAQDYPIDGRSTAFTPNIKPARACLRYSVRLSYAVDGPAEFLLHIHAARTARQRVLEEHFEVSPLRRAKVVEDPATGNRIAAFRAESGEVIARYEATVELRHHLADPNDIVVESPGALPPETLHFLYQSRYCQTDIVQQQAWDRFGHLPRGYGQVRAVCDWVKQTLRFQVGTSGPGTSVLDTLRDGVGVCRDFAHTMITFCRALNYPSRFVTGVDYGAEPSLGPPDFHAYVEVFMGGAWYLFDPTGITTVTGLIRIATGRDAADVSFATIFGPVRTTMPQVAFNAIEDPSRGYVLPTGTDFAISTAP